MTAQGKFTSMRFHTKRLVTTITRSVKKRVKDDTVTYDDTEVPVTVSVKDNEGQLEATATYEGNAVFTNTYTPKAGSVVLEAEKVLTGRSLVAGEFHF